MKASNTVTGHVNLIQEQRFRLVLDDGRSFLFTLDHKASIAVSGLERFKRNHARVQIEFTGEPDQTSGVARAVRLAER